MRKTNRMTAFYLIEPEDRGHFGHKGGKGHGDLKKNWCIFKWGHRLKQSLVNWGVQTRDLHLDPCKVVANLKVLPHEEVERGRSLWSHLHHCELKGHHTPINQYMGRGELKICRYSQSINRHKYYLRAFVMAASLAQIFFTFHFPHFGHLCYGGGAVLEKTLAKCRAVLCCFIEQQVWIPWG